MRTTAQFCYLVILMIFLLNVTFPLVAMQAIQRYVTSVLKEKPQVTAPKSSYSQLMSKPARLSTTSDLIPIRMRRQVPPHMLTTALMFIALLCAVYILLVSILLSADLIIPNDEWHASMIASFATGVVSSCGGYCNQRMRALRAANQANRPGAQHRPQQGNSEFADPQLVLRQLQQAGCYPGSPPPYSATDANSDPSPQYESVDNLNQQGQDNLNQQGQDNLNPPPSYESTENGHHDEQIEMANLGESQREDNARAAENGDETEMGGTEAGAIVEEPLD